MKKLWILLCTVLLAGWAMGQEGEDVKPTYETFKDTRIVNSHSVEMEHVGELKLIIGHRFGQINRGWRDLFGIDAATMRWGLDYGITDYLSIGFGRSSFQKNYDGYAKVRLLHQSSGARNMPLSLVYFTDVALNSSEWADPDRENFFSSRLIYSHQLLIARKVSDFFSVQLMPTLVHRNLITDSEAEKNDVYSMGAATRFQLTKSVAFNAEYFYTLADQINTDIYQTSILSFGVNIETNGHHFQLHVSNAQGMVNRFYVAETTGDFFNGDIHLGFNITRSFQIRGRKYK